MDDRWLELYCASNVGRVFFFVSGLLCVADFSVVIVQVPASRMLFSPFQLPHFLLLWCANIATGEQAIIGRVARQMPAEARLGKRVWLGTVPAPSESRVALVSAPHPDLLFELKVLSKISLNYSRPLTNSLINSWSLYYCIGSENSGLP